MGNKKSKPRRSQSECQYPQCFSREQSLLTELRPVLEFLDLPSILKIIFLNKNMLLAVSDSPFIFLFILKKHFLSKENINHHTKRGFEKFVLTRVKVNENCMPPSDQQLYTSLREKVIITQNLLQAPTIKESFERLNKSNRVSKEGTSKEIFHYKISSNLDLTESYKQISYKIQAKEFPPELLESFKAKKAAIKFGCFIVLGKFVSISGLLKVIVWDEKEQFVFERGASQDFRGLAFSIASKEIFANITNEDLEITDKFDQYQFQFLIWIGNPSYDAGNFEFYSPYIKGDLIENEKIIL